MVSEDSCKSMICSTPGFTSWISDGIKKMPVAPSNANVFTEHEQFIEKLVNEICDSALQSIQECDKIMTRDSKITKEERYQKTVNRKMSLVYDDDEFERFPVEIRNNFVNLNRNDLKRSVSAKVITNNNRLVQRNSEPVLIRVTAAPPDNTLKEKKKKKLSFTNLFHKKDKHKVKEHKHDEEAETLDNLPQLPNFRSSLGMTKKYASALELNQKSNSNNKLHRSPSFIQKLVHISEDSSNFLRRSLSFRDMRKKDKVVLRESLTELKKQEWRQSLQSLVESDTSVSYKDLSFIDYDALNQFSYDDGVFLKPGMIGDKNNYVARSQSMKEKRSPQLRRPQYQRHTSASECNPQYRSTLSLSESTGALSLPSLYHQQDQNAEEGGQTLPSSKLRRRPQSICSEDGDGSNGSFRSTGNGSSKLKRHNACRQKVRHPATFVETRQKNESDKAEGHEWRKFVGSIRRKVQRHATSSPSSEPPVLPTKGQPLSRKNSLTNPKLEMFKKEKSEDKDQRRKLEKQPLAKQKSVGQEGASSKTDYFKALSFKDKSKSVSVKHDNSLFAPQPADPSLRKGVRKSEKKDIKPSLSFSRCKSSGTKNKEGVKQDDFLKATMRIFLVVSPPVGKLQVRSRSLNHLDSLDMRQAVVSTTETALKDSRSEPDCTRPLLVPQVVSKDAESSQAPSAEVPPARKYMLSRSQKSSSECFSVNFEVGDESTWDNELFFPAQRGITLHDSLAKLCELRNIDLSSCDARLQDKESNSESLLHFTQDTANLVGRHVRITAKDTSNKKLSGSFYGNHSRKPSGSYRPRTSSFFSSSTEEQPVASSNLSLHDGDQSKKQIKQRLTAFFGNSKDTKYEALIEQLDRYSRQGIPQNVNYPQGQCESIDALYKLEDDWRDIINCTELGDKQQQQQTALWELIKTEVAYIKTLKVVTDLFLACLRDLQSKNLLKEIDTDKLFSNVTEILDANVIFWRNTLFPLVRDMRKHKRTSCIENMLEGFFKIHDTFQPYFKYCAEQSRCQHYCRENLYSEVFTAYLTWCESQKDCNRLRLMDILVQPMQRLTKYGLLLKAILKNTEEDVERESLQTMIRMVDEFVNNVNSSLKHRQDKERLKGIIARIESYDVVESKDDDVERILKKDKAFTQLDLTRPMLGCPQERKRHLLLEGDLKLKDTGASKMEVHCFLLTDMLLICKPSTKKGGATMRVIRQPYLVDRLVVQELNRETPSLAVIYKNEFDMAVAAFILQSSDGKKIKGWKEGIAKAQSLYAQAKQMSYIADESVDTEYSLDYNLESDYHSLQLAPRSPLASSSRASRVSSLAHSHSGSVEMNDQSSVGSNKDHSRGISMENDNRTGSISSDEGVQPLPPDKSPISQKNSFKNRLFPKTPNTLSVQPYGNLGQSLPNLTLGSPNVGSLSLSLNQHTLSVPSSKNGGQLLSPTHRGISYPPPSPTRGNLRRSLAISQSKNPPLIKTRQVNSASSVCSNQLPTSFDFDVPVIAGVSQPEEGCESFSRGQHRQAMKRSHRYHTAGVVDEIKKNDSRDANIYKRLSWNCTSQDQRPPTEDQT